ncbi:D-Ala-D-Ala carboxypeptidase family metallohydrolase [Prevotella dentasini]|uniref:D-Ala-D-Ala carboxypeptidase family metallohydrolase n=1 Tax=Prevotella dentasini TaxID=589537 RepID=UPI0004697D11|nr:D-Ala-D-Ala carboxypeptidase family metallohydrolase [Prevotella dentasini]
MIDYEERLSEHFTLGELLRSGTAIRAGIRNIPSAHPEDGLTDEEVRENLRQLCLHVLEPLRRRVGRLTITSGYRCSALNRAVGGVPCSQHLRGEAADIYLPNEAAGRRYVAVLRQLARCDQILLEPLGAVRKRWLHVSYGRAVRRQKDENIKR